jgi:hypothetical protein
VVFACWVGKRWAYCFLALAFLVVSSSGRDLGCKKFLAYDHDTCTFLTFWTCSSSLLEEQGGDDEAQTGQKKSCDISTLLFGGDHASYT